MKNRKRRILVTSALPYANGAIHLGHMLEYIQTDIWARFQRAQGHECYFAWADDAHGTPVMLWARSEGKPPEELIDMMNEEHKTDFRDFGVSFDNYSSTHSEYNREQVEQIYRRLDRGGYIERRDIKQLYDGAYNRARLEDEIADPALQGPASVMKDLEAMPGGRNAVPGNDPNSRITTLRDPNVTGINVIQESIQTRKEQNDMKTN